MSCLNTMEHPHTGVWLCVSWTMDWQIWSNSFAALLAEYHTLRLLLMGTVATIETLDEKMLVWTWQEMEYRFDVLRATKGAHVEPMRVKRGKYGTAPECKGGDTVDPRENPPTSGIKRVHERNTASQFSQFSASSVKAIRHSMRIPTAGPLCAFAPLGLGHACGPSSAYISTAGWPVPFTSALQSLVPTDRTEGECLTHPSRICYCQYVRQCNPFLDKFLETLLVERFCLAFNNEILSTGEGEMRQRWNSDGREENEYAEKTRWSVATSVTFSTFENLDYSLE
ncbi:hypothetical protein PR048_002662 [Dryococelus australis]|uniref:Uncharacterized protein n=1 Tax=Dryococelus australis TaxID=614101 RepID=A0ABQ9IKT5_9NEOP|nr:hypothetical protein PR048_002662 [Dryococelus australis]